MTDLFYTQVPCFISSFEGLMLCGSCVSQMPLPNEFGNVDCMLSARLKIFSNKSRTILVLECLMNFGDQNDVILLKEVLNNQKRY